MEKGKEVGVGELCLSVGGTLAIRPDYCTKADAARGSSSSEF